MTTALPALETQRSEIQRKISQLGDMRSGSITTTGGRCGNTGCHCRKDGDPGHGPFHRLTRKVEGKTVTETFANPVALRKAQQEVAEFHRFRELSEAWWASTRKICTRRPVEQQPGGWTEQEKKRLKQSIRKSTGSKRTAEPHLSRAPPSGSSWIWKRWRWPFGPRFIRPARRVEPVTTM